MKKENTCKKHHFPKYAKEIKLVKRGDSKGNNRDIFMALFPCKKCPFVYELPTNL